MNPRPLLVVALCVVGVTQFVHAALDAVATACDYSEYPSTGELASIGAFGLSAVLAAVVIGKRHRLAAFLASPLGYESGHGVRRVLFLGGLPVLGLYLVLDGAIYLASYVRFWFHDVMFGAVVDITHFFVAPSVKMAIGALLFFLQPVLAHALAPGRDEWD